MTDTDVTATHFPFPPDTAGAPGAGDAPPREAPPPAARTGYDAIAAELVQGLSAPASETAAWGPGRTLFWSILTFGLAPAFAWRSSFGRFVRAEREQFTRFAGWARRHSIRPEAAALHAAAARLGVRPFGSFAPAAFALAVFLVFAAHGVNDLAGVFAHTYRFPLFSPKHVMWENWSWPFLAWNAGLAATYLAQGLAVFLHRLDVRRFIAHFNRLADAEGVDRIEWPRRNGRSTGSLLLDLALFVGPQWLVAASLLLLFAHAPWGFALALAGAERRHYLLVTDPAVRLALAQRVTDLVVLKRRGASSMARVFGRCPRGGCGAPLARDSAFCPRCGAGLLDRVSLPHRAGR